MKQGLKLHDFNYHYDVMSAILNGIEIHLLLCTSLYNDKLTLFFF